MPAKAHLRVAELAHLAGLDRAAELRGHRLHAVADAEHGDAELEHGLRRARRFLLCHRGVAAGQDHAARIERPHEIGVYVVRMQLAIHPAFAHAARDQLGDLGAKIEDEDLVQGSRRRRGARTGGPDLPVVIQRGNSALPS